MAGLVALFIWAFIVIGHVANIIQAVLGWIDLQALGEASGLLIVKTVCIFIPIAGTVLGWMGMF